jgi:hypothetical protein
MTFFWGSGGFTPIPLPALVPPFLDVKTVAGFFAGSSVADMVVLAGGQLYSFSALGGGFFSPQFDFLPLAANYNNVARADFDGDGFSDVEAVRDDGTIDLYYGSASGLGRGLPVSGLPTADGSDGKFMALVSSSAELHTPEREYIQTVIAVADSQTSLDVEIFDGDMGATSTFDTGERGGAISCFNLWESVDGETYGTQIANSNDLRMDDAKWTSIYHGPASGPSAAGGGHFYILDTYLANSDCSDMSHTVTGPFLNAFKVRATGQVGVLNNDLSFVAHDVEGDWVAETDPPDTTLLDTSFDGTFSFFVYVGIDSNEIVFQDADADVKTDDDPGSNPRGPRDVKSDGQAVGASDTIGYTVLDPSGQVAFSNTNPSGEDDDVNLTDLEAITVPTNGVSGVWTWAWSGVLTHNDIRLFAPLASPATYEMYGQPTVRLSPSSAQLTNFWSTHLGQGAAFLPIRLGFGDDAVLVRRRDQLSKILDKSLPELGGAHSGRTLLCRESLHHPASLVMVPEDHAHLLPGDDPVRPAAIASLASELLTAKLNVRRAIHKGERLLDSFVYGKTVTVRETLEEADSLLSKIDLDAPAGFEHTFSFEHCFGFNGRFDDNDHDHGHDSEHGGAHHEDNEPSICAVSSQFLASTAEVTGRLRAINAGQVRKLLPQSNPAPHAPTLIAAKRPLVRSLATTATPRAARAGSF